jgi:Holliday junction DNA helicase RuvB
MDEKPIEENIDDTLRPQRLDSFVGQEKLKKSLSIFLVAAKNRQEPLSHVLFSGPPGLGKTTLAQIISKEMGVNFKITSGPALQKTGDLAAILSNLEDGDVLFIDEIHRLNRSVEEVLYPGMEDFALDIVLGKGPSAKTLRLDLPKFTLIGATTKLGSISSPMRDRFGVIYQLDFYQTQDLRKIIERSAKILNIKITPQASSLIANRARKTPRIANRLLHRVRDYTQYKGVDTITEDLSVYTLDLLDIDEMGLDLTDRRLLLTIAEKFSGGPVGIKTLAAAINDDPEAIEEVIEPFLLQLGFIDRSPQGRKITPAGLRHIGLSPKTID